MKKLILVVAALMLAACTTTNARVAATVEKPQAGATILIVKPDVSLALLTAAGMPEARADWTQQGTANLQAALSKGMEGRGHTFKVVDPADAMAGREGQLLRLHKAVGDSIIAFNYSGVFTLPTKEGKFDWTIGDGAATLADTYGADYALFTSAQGTYASSGRVVAMVAFAALGVSMPLGQQVVFTSLVDLRTGRVVWFNYAVAGPNDDMRRPEGATTLMTTVMKGAPL